MGGITLPDRSSIIRPLAPNARPRPSALPLPHERAILLSERGGPPMPPETTPPDYADPDAPIFPTSPSTAPDDWVSMGPDEECLVVPPVEPQPPSASDEAHPGDDV